MIRYIRRIKSLLRRPENWCVGQFSNIRSQGRKVLFSYSLDGALFTATEDAPPETAIRVYHIILWTVRKLTGFRWVSEYNDHATTTHQSILALLEDTILRLRREVARSRGIVKSWRDHAHETSRPTPAAEWAWKWGHRSSESSGAITIRRGFAPGPHDPAQDSSIQ